MPTWEKLKAIADHPRFPTPPAFFLKVLESVSNPDCSVREVAEQIKLDPGLTAKVLKTVNSALFGRGQRITSIDRALNLLGFKAMRAMAFALVLPGVQRKKPVDRQTCEFWMGSVAGALLAREVALRLRRPDFEDFLLAGLMRDLGILVLDQLYPHGYPQLLAQHPDLVVFGQTRLEEERFEVNHAQVSAYLLRQWNIPEDLCRAIEHHHDWDSIKDQAPDFVLRTWILYFATRTAQMLQYPHLAELSREVVTMANERLGLSQAELGDFIAPLDKKVRDLAGVMNVDIGRHENYQAILTRALETVAQLNLENSLENVKAHHEKEQLAQEVDHWRHVAGSVQQGAMRDSLTGLYNRGFFTEALRLAYHQGRRRQHILGLMFLDLDGFKALNDRFGHAFGDEVLKEVAAVLRNSLRSSDVVARLGGDEFCVLVQHVLPDDLYRLAHALWNAINSLTVRREAQEGKVGVSVGAVVGKPWERGQSAEDFLNAADQAMYTVKKAAKNQVHLVSWLDPEDCQREAAIRQQMFSTFLMSRHQLAPETLQRCRETEVQSRVLLGRLARQLGWVRSEDLANLLRLKRQTGRPLVEIAVAQGLLTPGQGLLLLAIQREHPDRLVKALVQAGAINDQVGRRFREEYYQTPKDDASVRKLYGLAQAASAN